MLLLTLIADICLLCKCSCSFFLVSPFYCYAHAEGVFRVDGLCYSSCKMKWIKKRSQKRFVPLGRIKIVKHKRKQIFYVLKCMDASLISFIIFYAFEYSGLKQFAIFFFLRRQLVELIALAWHELEYFPRVDRWRSYLCELNHHFTVALLLHGGRMTSIEAMNTATIKKHINREGDAASWPRTSLSDDSCLVVLGGPILPPHWGRCYRGRREGDGYIYVYIEKCF